MPGLQVLDAVQNGTVELGHGASATRRQGSNLALSAPLRSVSCRQQNAWFYAGEGQKLIDDSADQCAVAHGQYRHRMGGWFELEPADLEV